MTETTWGIQFNEHSNYQRIRKGQKPEGCPEWLESHQISTWQEKGLIIWNNIDRKIESLPAYETLRLQSELNSHDTWKSKGVSVTRLVHRIEIDQPSRKKRKTGEPEPDTEKPKSEAVYEEILHLPPEAGYELIELLESKKLIISRMAEQEEKRFKDAMKQLWDHLFEFSHQAEMNEFDFKARSFEWQKDGDSRMICHYQTAEGRIWLAKEKIFWNTCVKREGHDEKSKIVMKFIDAVEWVEKEIVELANEPDLEKEERFLSKEQIQANRIRLKAKLKNGPFWIDPARMEPQRITYRIIIDLDAKPLSYQSFETICGDTYEYAERYPTPAKLANEINLDVNHFQIDQPIGDNTEWFRFTSLTSYYQEASAAEQAQRVWDQSWILQQFKVGKIIHAQFGYQEIETGFVVLLGACGQTDRYKWREEESRSDFMEWQALRESLCYALDVKDYRDYLGFSAEVLNDEQLLEFMHDTRSESKLVPDEARKESRIWLAQHMPLD